MVVFSIIQKYQLEGAKRLDAEYYQPEYLASNLRLKERKAEFLGNIVKNITCGPFGSAILQENYQEKGVPLIRVADLNDWFVSGENCIFIDDELSQKMKKYQVADGDIVVSQRGTIAMFSRITDRFLKWNISANLISIKKSENINFNYLIAFLNSKYGIYQLYQRLSGQVQPKITTDDIRQILVFIPEKAKQNEIAKLVVDSWKKEEDGISLYRQAENLLLEELKIYSMGVDDKLGFTVDLSEIKKNNRCDAEYFQPKYKKIVKHIEKNCGGVALGKLITIKKGVEPGAEEYQDEGKQFIRVSSLSKFGINYSGQKYLSEELYNKLKVDYEPKKGEILLTKDASPGIAYVLKENVEGIVAGGILRLKLRSKEVEDEYLTLCINSIVGQMQVERDAGGSVIAHWRPEQVKNILIPILPKPIQQKISDLVSQSHEARKKAKELLEEAKRKVEEMIEKGGE